MERESEIVYTTCTLTDNRATRERKGEKKLPEKGREWHVRYGC